MQGMQGMNAMNATNVTSITNMTGSGNTKGIWLNLDIGYSAAKLLFNGKFEKIPTAISFALDSGINYGEDKDTYFFENEKYCVGEEATNDESFTTTNYSFMSKFGPLITYHVRKKLGIPDDAIVNISTGLALTDWAKKDDFIARLSKIEVDGKVIQNNISIIPQGAGVYYDYVYNNLNGLNPGTVSIIDIGYNTVNFLVFEDGKPVRKKSKGYSGHGVCSIVSSFRNYMESKYNMPFYEQEAIKYFLRGSFTFNGVEQENVKETIISLKRQFVQKLMNSVLINEKKTLSTSDVVILAGGGTYFLENGINFPPNVHFKEVKPYEFSNVRGYGITAGGN